MKTRVAVVSVVMLTIFCGVALAVAPGGDVLQKAALTGARPSTHMIIEDADKDGFFSFMDCNDDNPAVRPNAAEVLNGVDDDCDGAIDEGFDTTADSPRLTTPRQIWPNHKANLPEEFLDLATAQPRIVAIPGAAEASFAAAWSDRGDRLRLALLDASGNPRFEPPLILRAKARLPDLAWTGNRLAIAYEDWSTSQPTAHLMVLEQTGDKDFDIYIGDGRQPRVVWGQDRFGVVWLRPNCLGDCLAFARLSRNGVAIGPIETLEASGYNAEISWSGTGILLTPLDFQSYPGEFGIAYQAYGDFAATADVLLSTRPLEPWQGANTVRVNTQRDPLSPYGAVPSIAGNAAGFAVTWHFIDDKANDRICARFFSLTGLQPVQEFGLDSDAGQASRILWTGGEHVVVTDNLVATATDGIPVASDVHFRRADMSLNSHLAVGWGSWNEVNVSRGVGAGRSVRPDVANLGDHFGVIWVEQEPSKDYGRIYFASVLHE